MIIKGSVKQNPCTIEKISTTPMGMEIGTTSRSGPRPCSCRGVKEGRAIDGWLVYSSNGDLKIGVPDSAF